MGDYKSDRWVNGQGVLDGQTAMIRKNVSLYRTRKADYPTLLLVSLVYRETADNGLPASSEELDQLDRTEESLADHFCARYDALFALCVTNDGSRDMFLFLPQQPAEDEVAAAIEACSPSVDYDFCVRRDPEWRPFMTMLPQTDDERESGAVSSPRPWWRRLFFVGLAAAVGASPLTMCFVRFARSMP